MRRACFWPVSLVALMGCSAIVNPDVDRIGGADSGQPVMDSGTPPGDAGRDAGARPDTGPPCVTGARCEGDTLISCRGGVESRQDCQAGGAYCLTDHCQPWVCTPSSRECTADLRGLVVCTPRGDNEALTPCELGCDPTARTCVTTSLTCSTLPRITLGTPQRFDLCRETDEDTYTPTPDGCPATQRANVGDRTFVLTLTSDTDVVIDLRDVDTAAAVDTVVYVRRVCDDAGTQVACDDDIPCSESTVPGCFGSTEVRQSRIETRLAAGTYYIVADAFAYRTETVMYRCGMVELRVDDAG